MLIPLADFLNHNMVANVRTATLAEDALRFVATRNIMPGEELCIDYAQASNLEFLVRYGFRVEDNPYGGRQFDLGGEPLQAHCPSYILRYDTPDIVENATLDCHQQARYLSFEQQFGTLAVHEQVREDRYIYSAIAEACSQLLSMLTPPGPLTEPETEARGTEGITSVLVREIQAERELLQRCVSSFSLRNQELEPRPVPPVLAEPLARLRGQDSASAENLPEERLNPPPPSASSGHWDLAGSYSGSSMERTPEFVSPSRPQAPSRAGDGRPADGAGRGPAGAFAPQKDRQQVDQLLWRLQQGISIS